MPMLPKPDSQKAAVAAMHVSPADKSHIYFRGIDEVNWFTKDMGKTYKASNLDLHDCRLHPSNADWIMCSSRSPGCSRKKTRKSEEADPCYKSLQISKDFGETWTLGVKYVVQFDWSPIVGIKDPKTGYPSDTLAFATVNSLKVGDQKFGFWDKNIHFVSSHDFFKTSEITVQHGNRFLFGDNNYLFVAAVNPKDEEEVTLEVSRSNETLRFFPAVLPVSLSQHSYTILDTSEGSVFLHVNHRPFGEAASTGHVYISDWSGLKYSLSLPYNHRSSDGKCDFEKIEGLEGIYMANFVDVEDEDDKVEDEEEGTATSMAGKKGGAKKEKPLKTKTVITFDKGAEWSYLSPPRIGVDGKEIKCTGDCHLHLHGITDYYGPFYSSSKCLGVIMATGTVGRYLRQSNEINTYLSRDAGLTWKEVAKGSHIYELGDHGGLIVMANDVSESNTIMYSWNEGTTWTELQISEEKFQIENIIIEPTSTAQDFVVYGTRQDVGVLVYVDFSELHGRNCVGHDAPDTSASDYETWTPSDGRLSGKCLMGHTVNYVRRKAESQCFNPEEFERPVFQEHCVCTREDFECDYGFETQSMEGGPCLAAKPKHADPTAHPEGKCVGEYRISKGYRRVPGDTCTGGAEWDAVVTPCPNAWLGGGGSGKTVLSILVLVCLSLAIVTLASKYDLLDYCSDNFKMYFSDFKYKMVGGDSPVSMADDDAFYLNDDEFSQSAQLIRDDDPSRSDMTFSALPERNDGQTSIPMLAPPTKGIADALDDI